MAPTAASTHTGAVAILVLIVTPAAAFAVDWRGVWPVPNWVVASTPGGLWLFVTRHYETEGIERSKDC
jgi:hypothetical protein